jgi:DNA repair ATPase RecN
MSELDGKLNRLQEARKKAEEIARRRQRIAGELDGHLKRLAELEKKCREDYNCEVAELSNLSTKLEQEAEKSIAEAERLLTTPAGQVDSSKTLTAKPEPQIVAKPEPPRGPSRRTLVTTTAVEEGDVI